MGLEKRLLTGYDKTHGAASLEGFCGLQGPTFVHDIFTPEQGFGKDHAAGQLNFP